jgi:hypothetical protein
MPSHGRMQGRSGGAPKRHGRLVGGGPARLHAYPGGGTAAAGTGALGPVRPGGLA